MAALPPRAAVGDAILGKGGETPELPPEPAAPAPASESPEQGALREDAGDWGSVSLDPRFGEEDPATPSPPKLYRVGRQGGERFSDARALAATMEDLGGRLTLNGSYRARIEGETAWSGWENRDAALSRIRWRLRTRYVGDVVAVGTADAFGNPGRTLLVRIVRKHPKPPKPKPEPQPTRPANTAGNDKIDLLHAAAWRAFPDLESWGICNCRRISGSSSWSQHAWCNAEDLRRDVGGKSDKASMAPVAYWLYANRAKYHIQNIIWRRDPKCDDPTNDHCNHIHVDMQPTLRGTPPCAR